MCLAGQSERYLPFASLRLQRPPRVMCLVIAYRFADPGSVSPFEYFGIPISFCLGWLFFREAPFDDLFPGILLIVMAGITIIVRERIVSRRADKDR